MPTFTEVMPAQKSAAKHGFKWTPTGHCCGLLSIESTRKCCRYLTSELPLPSDDAGRAFQLVKMDAGSDKETPVGDGYDVYLGERSNDVSCSCKGFIYGNGRVLCTHILACRGLVENRWI